MDKNTSDFTYINEEEKYSIEETEIKNVPDRETGKIIFNGKAPDPNKQK